MKRKGMMIMTIVLSILMIGITAWSQNVDECENMGTGECLNCKCPVGNIECANPQGGGDELEPFDFDGRSYIAGGFGAEGYCPGKNFNFTENNLRDCKFIFDVCECPESCSVNIGTKIGIQMMVDVDGNYETDDGVYFAGAVPVLKAGYQDAGDPTIYFDIQDEKKDYCDGYFDMPEVNVYRDAAGEEYPRDSSVIIKPIPQEIRNFGPVKYYSKFRLSQYQKNGRDYCTVYGHADDELDMADILNAEFNGGFDKEIPEKYRARFIESEPDKDYLITEDDAQGNCFIWVDIPPIRIDPTKAEGLRGSEIKVKVRFLFNREVQGVCQECNPVQYCECEMVVAKICCDPANCMFFPYVLQGLETSLGWTSGIAVTANPERGVDAMPENPSCTFTLTDQTGAQAIYSKVNMPWVWAFVLDNEISNFIPVPPATAIQTGAASLRVECNYDADGYSFLNAQTFGAGTQPRGCDGACCPGGVRP